VRRPLPAGEAAEMISPGISSKASESLAICSAMFQITSSPIARCGSRQLVSRPIE
jgi:hypothetical protein